MPGVSRYDRKQPEKVLPSYETVKAKFGAEDMTIEELTVFLRNSPRGARPDLTEKSVKNYIKTLCESSEGLLKPEDFKKNPGYSKSPYCIKPEWQGLLIALMDSDYFEGRKNDRRLKTRADLNRQLAENVEKYLGGDDKRIVMENPAFINAELESRLTKHINQELVILMRTMYHVSPVIRYKLMLDFFKALVNMRVWMSRQDSKEEATRLVYAHELDEIHNAIYQKGLFSSKSLDELLISLLATRMHDEEYVYVDGDEEMTPIGVYFATLIFEGEFPDTSAAKRQLDELERTLNDDSRVQTIQKKAKEILDLKDPFEQFLYDDLIRMAKLRLCTPYVSPEEYERMVRFTESAIAQDKWDILNRLMKLGDHPLDEKAVASLMEK